jgi:hypothetical protein
VAPAGPSQSRSPGAEAVVGLDALLERRRDDQAAPAILRALAVLAPGDDLAAQTLLQALLPGLVRLADRPVPEATCGTQELGGIESPLFIERGPAGPRNANKRSSSKPARAGLDVLNPRGPSPGVWCNDDHHVSFGWLV